MSTKTQNGHPWPDAEGTVVIIQPESQARLCPLISFTEASIQHKTLGIMGGHQWRGLWTWEVLLWKAGSRNKAAGWNAKLCLVDVRLWLLLPVDFKKDLGASQALRQSVKSASVMAERGSQFGSSVMTCFGPLLHPNPLEISHSKQRCGFRGAVGRILQGPPLYRGCILLKERDTHPSENTIDNVSCTQWPLLI